MDPNSPTLRADINQLEGLNTGQFLPNRFQHLIKIPCVDTGRAVFTLNAQFRVICIEGFSCSIHSSYSLIGEDGYIKQNSNEDSSKQQNRTHVTKSVKYHHYI